MAAASIPSTSGIQQIPSRSKEDENNRPPTVEELLIQIENHLFKGPEHRASLIIAAWSCLGGGTGCFRDIDKVFQMLYRESAMMVFGGLWTRINIIFKRGLARALSQYSHTMASYVKGSEGLCSALVMAVFDPWGDPIIKSLLSEAEVNPELGKEFVNSEPHELLIVRVECLVKAKLEDAAIRLLQCCLQNLPTSPAEEECGDVENWRLAFKEWLLRLLFRKRRLNDLIAESSSCSCHDGVRLIRQAFQSNFEDSEPLTETLINLFLVRDLLFQSSYCCTAELMKLWCEFQAKKQKTSSEIQEAACKLLVGHASCSAHFYLFVDILFGKFGNSLLPLYLEMYIRGLTSDLNFLEAARQADNKESIIEIENHMAAMYFKLFSLFNNINKEIALECLMSAFSLDPTKERLEWIKKLTLQISKEKAIKAASKDDPKNKSCSRSGCSHNNIHNSPFKKKAVVMCDQATQVGDDLVESVTQPDVKDLEANHHESCDAAMTICDKSEPMVDDKVVIDFEEVINTVKEDSISRETDLNAQVPSKDGDALVDVDMKVSINQESDKAFCSVDDSLPKKSDTNCQETSAKIQNCSELLDSVEGSSSHKVISTSSSGQNRFSENCKTTVNNDANISMDKVALPFEKGKVNHLSQMTECHSVSEQLHSSAIDIKETKILSNDDSKDVLLCEDVKKVPDMLQNIASVSHNNNAKDQISICINGYKETENTSNQDGKDALKLNDGMVEENKIVTEVIKKGPGLNTSHTNPNGNEDVTQQNDALPVQISSDLQSENPTKMLDESNAIPNVIQPRVTRRSEALKNINMHTFSHIVMDSKIPGISSETMSDFVVLLESLRNKELKSSCKWSQIKHMCEDYLEKVTSLRCTMLNSHLNGSVDSEADSASDITEDEFKDFEFHQSNDSVVEDPYVNKGHVLKRFLNSDKGNDMATYVNLSDIHCPQIPLEKLFYTDHSSSHGGHKKKHKRHRNHDKSPDKLVLKKFHHGSRAERDLVKRRKRKKRKAKKGKGHTKKHCFTHGKVTKEYVKNKKKKHKLKKKKDGNSGFISGDYCSDFSSEQLMQLVKEHSNSYSKMPATTSKHPHTSALVARSVSSSDLSDEPARKKRKVSFSKKRGHSNKHRDKHKHIKSKSSKHKKTIVMETCGAEFNNVMNDNGMGGNIESVKDYSHIVQYSSVKKMEAVQIRQRSVALNLSQMNNKPQNQIPSGNPCEQNPQLQEFVQQNFESYSPEDIMKMQMLLSEQQPNVSAANNQAVLKYFSAKTTSRLLSVAQASNCTVGSDSETIKSPMPTFTGQANAHNFTTVQPSHLPPNVKHLIIGPNTQYALANTNSSAAGNSLIPVNLAGNTYADTHNFTGTAKNSATVASPQVATFTIPVGHNSLGGRLIGNKIVIPLPPCSHGNKTTSSTMALVPAVTTTYATLSCSQTPANVIIVKSGNSTQIIQQPSSSHPILANTKLVSISRNRPANPVVCKTVPKMIKQAARKLTQPVIKRSLIKTPMFCGSSVNGPTDTAVKRIADSSGKLMSINEAPKAEVVKCRIEPTPESLLVQRAIEEAKRAIAESAGEHSNDSKRSTKAKKDNLEESKVLATNKLQEQKVIIAKKLEEQKVISTNKVEQKVISTNKVEQKVITTNKVEQKVADDNKLDEQKIVSANKVENQLNIDTSKMEEEKVLFQNANDLLNDANIELDKEKLPLQDIIESSQNLLTNSNGSNLTINELNTPTSPINNTTDTEVMPSAKEIPILSERCLENKTNTHTDTVKTLDFNSASKSTDLKNIPPPEEHSITVEAISGTGILLSPKVIENDSVDLNLLVTPATEATSVPEIDKSGTLIPDTAIVEDKYSKSPQIIKDKDVPISFSSESITSTSLVAEKSTNAVEKQKILSKKPCEEEKKVEKSFFREHKELPKISIEDQKTLLRSSVKKQEELLKSCIEEPKESKTNSSQINELHKNTSELKELQKNSCETQKTLQKDSDELKELQKNHNKEHKELLQKSSSEEQKDAGEDQKELKKNSSEQQNELQPINAENSSPATKICGKTESRTSISEVQTRSFTSISDAVRFSLMDMDDGTDSVENQVLQAFQASHESAPNSPNYDNNSTNDGDASVASSGVTLTTPQNASTTELSVSRVSQRFESSVHSSQTEKFSDCQSTVSRTTTWILEDSALNETSQALGVQKSSEVDSSGELKDEERPKKKKKRRDRNDRDLESAHKFWCEICHKGFFSAYNLRRHCRNVHKMDLPKGSSDLPFGPKSSSELPFANNSQCHQQGESSSSEIVTPPRIPYVQQSCVSPKGAEFLLQSPSNENKNQDFSLKVSSNQHTPQMQSSDFQMQTPPRMSSQSSSTHVSPVTPSKDFRLPASTSASQVQLSPTKMSSASKSATSPKFQRLPTSCSTPTVPQLAKVSQQISQISLCGQPALQQQMQLSQLQSSTLMQPMSTAACQAQQLQAAQCTHFQGNKQIVQQSIGQLQLMHHAGQLPQVQHTAHAIPKQTQVQQFKKCSGAQQPSKMTETEQLQQAAQLAQTQQILANQHLQKLMHLRQNAIVASATTPQISLGTGVQGAPSKNQTQCFQAQLAAARQVAAAAAAQLPVQQRNQAASYGLASHNSAAHQFFSPGQPNQDQSNCPHTFTSQNVVEFSTSGPSYPTIRLSSETNDGLEDLEQFLLENMPWSGEQAVSHSLAQQAGNRPSSADSLTLAIPTSSQNRPGAQIKNKSPISRPKARKPIATSCSKNLMGNLGRGVKKKSSSKKVSKIADTDCAGTKSDVFSQTSLVNQQSHGINLMSMQCSKGASNELLSSKSPSKNATISSVNETDSSDSVQCINVTLNPHSKICAGINFSTFTTAEKNLNSFCSSENNARLYNEHNKNSFLDQRNLVNKNCSNLGETTNPTLCDSDPLHAGSPFAFSAKESVPNSRTTFCQNEVVPSMCPNRTETSQAVFLGQRNIENCDMRTNLSRNISFDGQNSANQCVQASLSGQGSGVSTSDCARTSVSDIHNLFLDGKTASNNESAVSVKINNIAVNLESDTNKVNSKCDNTKVNSISIFNKKSVESLLPSTKVSVSRERKKGVAFKEADDSAAISSVNHAEHPKTNGSDISKITTKNIDNLSKLNSEDESDVQDINLLITTASENKDINFNDVPSKGAILDPIPEKSHDVSTNSADLEKCLLKNAPIIFSKNDEMEKKVADAYENIENTKSLEVTDSKIERNATNQLINGCCENAIVIKAVEPNAMNGTDKESLVPNYDSQGISSSQENKVPNGVSHVSELLYSVENEKPDGVKRIALRIHKSQDIPNENKANGKCYASEKPSQNDLKGTKKNSHKKKTNHTKKKCEIIEDSIEKLPSLKLDINSNIQSIRLLNNDENKTQNKVVILNRKGADETSVEVQENESCTESKLATPPEQISPGRLRLRDTPKTSVKRVCPCCVDNGTPKKCRSNTNKSVIKLFGPPVQNNKSKTTTKTKNVQNTRNTKANTRSSQRLRSRNNAIS